MIAAIPAPRKIRRRIIDPSFVDLYQYSHEAGLNETENSCVQRAVPGIKLEPNCCSFRTMMSDYFKLALQGENHEQDRFSNTRARQDSHCRRPRLRREIQG